MKQVSLTVSYQPPMTVTFRGRQTASDPELVEINRYVPGASESEKPCPAGKEADPRWVPSSAYAITLPGCRCGGADDQGVRDVEMPSPPPVKVRSPLMPDDEVVATVQAVNTLTATTPTRIQRMDGSLRRNPAFAWLLPGD